MALSKSTIQSTITDALNAQYGQPEDAAEQAKFSAAMADAIFKILTVQAAVTVNGVTTTGAPGGPLPIVNQPGVIV